MSGVLVVRPSSLGDVVYALALVSDIATHRPGFAGRLGGRRRLCRPGAPGPADPPRRAARDLRRWRHAPLARATWRDMAEFRRALRQERYDAILNLQEQVKGAVVSWFAEGTRHGLDRANIREPIATLVDHVHHPVSRDLHIVDRCRGIAAAALGYSADGPPRWQLRNCRPTDTRDAGRTVCAGVPRDEPRRQGVARGSLARAGHAFRARRIRHAAAVGQRRASMRAAMRIADGIRRRGGAATADAAGIGDARRDTPKSWSASTPG